MIAIRELDAGNWFWLLLVNDGFEMRFALLHMKSQSVSLCINRAHGSWWKHEEINKQIKRMREGGTEREREGEMHKRRIINL